MLKELLRNEKNGYRVMALNVMSVQGYKQEGKLSITGNDAVIDIERMSNDVIKIMSKIDQPIVLYFPGVGMGFFENPTVMNGEARYWQPLPFQGDNSWQTWSV